MSNTDTKLTETPAASTTPAPSPVIPVPTPATPPPSNVVPVTTPPPVEVTVTPVIFTPIETPALPPAAVPATSKICQNEKCKAENPATHIYCWKCGTPLPETEAEKPVCKNPKCNALNPKGAKYCCSCGKSLSNHKSFTTEEIKDLLIDGVFYALYIQFVLIMQMWVTSGFMEWHFETIWFSLAFSVLPTIGNAIKKKRGNKLSQSQAEIDSYNDEVREQRFKEAEERAKDKQKVAEIDKRIAALEAQ